MSGIKMKTIVIGLGNPILGDDGIGWRVVEQVTEEMEAGPQNGNSETIETECLAVGGLTLMEHLIGYERAILVDAITTGKVPDGTVRSFPIEALPNLAIGHFSSAHDTTLQNAIDMGRRMGAQLPEEIEIVAIEAQQIYDFSEELSAPVSNALPKAVKTVKELLL
jgi:hydrogenase maturation protease